MATAENTVAGNGSGRESQAQERGADQAQPEELKNLNYELLLIAFSILSVVNVGLLILIDDPTIENVLVIIDVPLTAIFFFDFLIRLRTAESKTGYFFRQFGWADLAA